jgi:hypothetical protein
MQRDRWFNLDDKSKSIWDQLPDKSKATILGYDGNVSVLSNSSFKAPTNLSTLSRKVNLKEITVHDLLLAYAHEVEQTSERHETIDGGNDINVSPPNTDTSANDTNDKCLVNATQYSPSKLHPGDILRVVSKSSKRFVNTMSQRIIIHQPYLSSIEVLTEVLLDPTHRTVDIRGIDIRGIDNHHCFHASIRIQGFIYSFTMSAGILPQ